MEKLTDWLLGRRKAVIAVFAVLAVLGAVLSLTVDVDYDITDYLPQDSESTVALNVMREEFASDVPNARVMVPDLTLAQALEMKARIAAVPGVSSVVWLDDVTDPEVPLEMTDSDTVAAYYRDGAALYTVTVAEGQERAATEALYDLVGESGAVTGSAASTAVMQEMTESQVVGAIEILVPVVVLILLLTTTSWIAPVLFLLTIGIAVLLNMGTNAFAGRISFVTQAVSPILQMAVSLDYAIFLLNAFERHRAAAPDARTAMCRAVRESFSAVAASAATTLFGFLALLFMRFGIGSDLGLNLVKGVAMSYITVMLLLPALALSLVRLMDKTRHRRLLPELRGAGRHLLRVRVPAMLLLLLLIVPCFLAQSRADFLYGNGDPDPTTRYGRDTLAVDGTFGKSTAAVVLVPRGDTGREAELCAALEKADHVTDVVAYVTAVGADIPDTVPDAAVVSNFYSDRYARIIVYTDAGEEGDAAFRTVEEIRAAVRGYYDESYVLGQSVNLYDIRDVVTSDTMKVNFAAIALIFLTLLVTFRSPVLPFILLLVIESAIWINLSVPYFTDTPLVYLGYLVINTVQLGATIDYAILLTEGYVRRRRTLPAREAVTGTLSENLISILTSALILASAGYCLKAVSSITVVSELGGLLGRGTLLSAALVLLVLPGLLLLADPVTAATAPKNAFLREVKK